MLIYIHLKERNARHSQASRSSSARLAMNETVHHTARHIYIHSYTQRRVYTPAQYRVTRASGNLARASLPLNVYIYIRLLSSIHSFIHENPRERERESQVAKGLPSHIIHTLIYTRRRYHSHIERSTACEVKKKIVRISSFSLSWVRRRFLFQEAAIQLDYPFTVRCNRDAHQQRIGRSQYRVMEYEIILLYKT